MPCLTSRVVKTGALVEIQVGVSTSRAEALRDLGIEIPIPRPARGLIDTGATCSAVDPRLLDSLNLSPTGATGGMTPSTGSVAQMFAQYDVSLSLLGTESRLDIPKLPVIASNISHHGFEVLIGRDVLRRCLLVYNGSQESFTLAF